jgi:hypothetical protein
MLRISARKLLGFTTAQLDNLLTGQFVLVFDDGEITTNYVRTLYSSHVWDIHRQFKDAPILKNHHVDATLRGGRLKSDTHLRLLGTVIFSIYDWAAQNLSEGDREDLREMLARMSYRITNNIYNDFSYRSEEYVTSVDITHFHQIFMHPEVQTAYATATHNSAGVGTIYAAIDAGMKDLAGKGNQLAEMYESGLIKKDQLKQCVGPRADVTDTNRKIFGRTIMRGYYEGICNIAESLQESRSASKSLEQSKETLQKTEYFARRLQLVSMSVENLHHGDCGTGRYLRWKVRGPQFTEGRMTYGGDLKNLVGKYYQDPVTQQLKVIRATDEHLVGQMINIRSVLHCQHPDPAGLCSTCLGELSLSVPKYSNIGHLASTYMTQQSTQGVLSTKHYDANAQLEAIVLSDADKPYLKVSSNKNSYLLSDNLRNKRVTLVIGASAAKNLPDILEVEDVRRLSIARISELKQINLRVNDGKQTIEPTLEVHEKDRLSSITHELLQHIKVRNWTLSADGHYEIDMAGWDFTKPILTLPARQFSMGDHSRGIAAFLESSVEAIAERDRFTNPEALLIDLFTYVNNRLSVNLAMLEIPYYASMIVSAETFNYSLPKPWTESGLGVMRRTMDYRSLSVRLAYERHGDVILNPDSFAVHNRPDSPFDMLFAPREVLAAGVRTR